MSLYSKNNGKNYYWKFRYNDAEGKIKSKSVNTGISKHGSKKEALRIGLLKEEEFLSAIPNKKTRHHDQKYSHAEDTVAEFANHWLNERIRYLNKESLGQQKKTMDSDIHRCMEKRHQK